MTTKNVWSLAELYATSQEYKNFAHVLVAWSKGGVSSQLAWAIGNIKLIEPTVMQALVDACAGAGVGAKVWYEMGYWHMFHDSTNIPLSAIDLYDLFLPIGKEMYEHTPCDECGEIEDVAVHTLFRYSFPTCISCRWVDEPPTGKKIMSALFEERALQEQDQNEKCMVA